MVGENKFHKRWFHHYQDYTTASLPKEDQDHLKTPVRLSGTCSPNPTLETDKCSCGTSPMGWYWQWSTILSTLLGVGSENSRLAHSHSSYKNFLLHDNFLCRLLFQYLFHPCVTTVACKRPRSYCQKCRWQVTAKYTCTLCMWFYMKWHGCMVYIECAEMAAVSCNTSHASSVSTPL